MPTTADILTRLLSDRYRIVRELGRGGMAAVLLADDLKHHRQVAIKVLTSDSAAVIGRERFLREIETAARLTHPHILALHDSGEADGHLYYVMPYIAGGSLRDWLDREKQLSIEDALRVTRQIASALGHAHREGLVHRDIKPENVLMADGIALVADFGIARVLSEVTEEQLTSWGHSIGTPRYMAPEQVMGSASVDGRADLYALACMLYEMLAGQPPFHGPIEGVMHQHLSVEPRSVSELRPTVPRAVAAAIAKGLAKLPADRFATAALFGDALASESRSHATSRETIPNNLPRERTRFIGRERELAECTKALDETRILTLTGIGGSGKTRLAVKLAESLLDQFPDGVWFADLAPLKDGDRVALVLATALELQEQPGTPLLQRICQRLREQRALIVLDNCEHVLTSSAELTDALTSTCDELKLVVTSREGLGVEGERLIGLRSLSFPPSSPGVDLETVEATESVRLFVDRARAVSSGFTLSERNAPAVAEICRRLEGIPLAIELAAARVSSLKVEDIAARLDDRFRLLTGGAKTALARHQTLRATIQWSYDQLTEPEQRLFRLLSVFAGGWTLNSATWVTGKGADEFDVLDLMKRLVDKSLVVMEHETEGETRYTMLETVRQFGQEQLHLWEEGNPARYRHFLYFLAMSEDAETQLSRAAQATWRVRLSQERENLLAAHAWAEHSDQSAEEGLRLVGALRRFWTFFGLHALGRRLILEALARPDAREQTPARAKALYTLSDIEFFMGRYDDGLEHAVASLGIARELGDSGAICDGLHALAHGQTGIGDLAAAKSAYEECIALARRFADPDRLPRALGSLAELFRYENDFDHAEALIEEALALQRRKGDRDNVAIMLSNLASVAVARGDYEKARPLLAELIRTVDVQGVFTIGALEALAAWLSGRKEWLSAARCFGAAEAGRTRVHLVKREPVDESFLGPCVIRIRGALGEKVFEATWAEGQAMGMESALAEARRQLEEEAAR